MGAAIGKIIEELVEVFKRNYKRPKLWIFVAIIGCIVILLFPYIDSNFFYFSRIEKRIDVLEKVMSLDQETIKKNDIFSNEYNSILQEIKQQNDHSIKSLADTVTEGVDGIGDYFSTNEKTGNGNPLIKFFSGAIWFIIITLCVPFMKTVFDNKKERLIAFFVMLIITPIVGFIFALIPAIISPWVNYIGVPLIQLILFCILIFKE